MPRRSATLLLADIRTAAERIIEFTRGLDAAGLADNRLVLDAVLYNFGVIGEAAAGVPDETQARHPELPWREMRGMRNLIMHEYFRVSVDRVHDAIQHDLPALLAQLRSLANGD